MMKTLAAVAAFLALFVLAACASEPERPRGKYHPATIVNEIFQVDQGMPAREVKQQEFFFKRCELNERFPHTTQAEYFCSGVER